jgi:hypothetical protein
VNVCVTANIVFTSLNCSLFHSYGINTTLDSSFSFSLNISFKTFFLRMLDNLPLAEFPYFAISTLLSQCICHLLPKTFSKCLNTFYDFMYGIRSCNCLQLKGRKPYLTHGPDRMWDPLGLLTKSTMVTVFIGAWSFT